VKSNNGKRKHLACNDLKATPRQIVIGYRLRWAIEIFHKELIGLSETPKVWVAEDQAASQVCELMKLEDSRGWGVSSELSRAIIMAGITQNEMHRLMTGCRKSKMKPTLWATLTPTSETWTIQSLLNELPPNTRRCKSENGKLETL
jgi:hypothetical protein